MTCCGTTPVLQAPAQHVLCRGVEACAVCCACCACRSNEAEPSPSSGGRAATFNTTAQRYAAYRLRAAQGE
jgi:hypothetical protein